ncbi:MAG: ArsR/SmtB family transcription factor [Nannocystaceae bacterium]|nr:metalloregulator ArsR/SmtB family transcription factor [bacterium]
MRREAAVAPLFAALGDETRLRIVSRLSRQGSQSISELCDVADVSRQAITKHLNVLCDVGMIVGERVGRERRFTMRPERIQDAREHLQRISAQWDAALDRLRAMVEE